MRLEHLEPRHAATLHANNSLDTVGAMWTYLGVGPFASLGEYESWVNLATESVDPRYYAICDSGTGEPLGVASYLRVDPNAGSIEIGWLTFSPKLQRSTIATEAIFRMIEHSFALGYRRCEWKCNALNAASCRAAVRFGFTYEGIFRQATISKGRNRDTAWYAIIDADWPAIQAHYEEWLDPANFDGDGLQLQPLRT